jgi:hypothetical protein
MAEEKETVDKSDRTTTTEGNRNPEGIPKLQKEIDIDELKTQLLKSLSILQEGISKESPSWNEIEVLKEGVKIDTNATRLFHKLMELNKIYTEVSRDISMDLT